MKSVSTDGTKITTVNEMLTNEAAADGLFTLADLRAEQIRRALAAGKHVSMQKPMATTVEDCRAVIHAAEKNQTILMLSHEKRFNPGFEKIKEIINDGMLGRVFYLVIHWSAAVRLDPDQLCPPDYRASYQWRWTDPDAGGGILMDHLPHYLDLWRWWTDSELESVSTELLNVRGDLMGDQQLGGPHEDFATVLMRSKAGKSNFTGVSQHELKETDAC